MDGVNRPAHSQSVLSLGQLHRAAPTGLLVPDVAQGW
jgi:hypothetical protein